MQVAARALITLALAVAAPWTNAQVKGAPPVLNIRLDGTPSFFADSGGQVSACGLRVFGIESLPPPRDVHRTVDVSILLGLETVAQGIGLVKASSIESSPAALKANQPVRQLRVTDGWVRLPGSERTTARDGKVLKDDDKPNAVRYLADARTLFAVVDAVLTGKEIEVSVVRADAAANPVYRGPVGIEQKARTQFVACMRDLERRVASTPR
jgi:hypothetical protein